MDSCQEFSRQASCYGCLQVAMLHGTTDNMTQEVSQEKLSAAWQQAALGQTTHPKRKASAGIAIWSCLE